MSTDQQELINVFNQLIESFNNKEYGRYAALLDDEVELFGIDVPLQPTAKGPENVVELMKAEFPQARFTLVTRQAVVVSNIGFVRGEAFWEDPGDGDNARIIYSLILRPQKDWVEGTPIRWRALRIGTTQARVSEAEADMFKRQPPGSLAERNSQVAQGL